MRGFDVLPSICLNQLSATQYITVSFIAETTNLKSLLESTQSSVKDKVGKLQDLHEQYNTLKAEHDNVKVQCESLTESLSCSEQTVNKLKEQIVVLSEEVCMLIVVSSI